jgi:hypothetical protein
MLSMFDMEPRVGYYTISIAAYYGALVLIRNKNN